MTDYANYVSHFGNPVALVVRGIYGIDRPDYPLGNTGVTRQLFIFDFHGPQYSPLACRMCLRKSTDV